MNKRDITILAVLAGLFILNFVLASTYLCSTSTCNPSVLRCPLWLDVLKTITILLLLVYILLNMLRWLKD